MTKICIKIYRNYLHSTTTEIYHVCLVRTVVVSSFEEIMKREYRVEEEASMKAENFHGILVKVLSPEFQLRFVP